MKKPADTIGLDEIGEGEARKFADEFLAEMTTIRAPRGLSHKTIAKHEMMLAGLWAWAIEGGKTTVKANPWLAREKRVPRVKRRAGAGGQDRTMYQPDEAAKLLRALPRGSRLGDLFRLALVTGCRVDEMAQIRKAALVYPAREAEAKDAAGSLPIGFLIASGKTENARRFVPVPEIARSILVREPERLTPTRAGYRGARRVSTAPDLEPQPKDRLFPEFPIREASGKAAAASQEFTRERRKALGEETDGRLSLHSARHTWRTMARRVGVPEDVVNELGEWAGEKRTSGVYDHGMAREQLIEAQNLRVCPRRR